ncbi:MAG TPA: hypothetical protein VK609_05355 [Mucilaginibacter sp.]|nr:hypothetical protein [Mucilaginibacter sp.]
MSIRTIQIGKGGTLGIFFFNDLKATERGSLDDTLNYKFIEMPLDTVLFEIFSSRATSIMVV